MIFKLETVMGHGATAKVYRATLQGSSKGHVAPIVAIKQSRVSLRVKRTILHYEAGVMQLLHGHCAIPAIYGYGRLEHFECFAMEYLGSSLQELHQGPRGLPLKTVLLVADQMLSGMEYIHEQGFVHRDIKPQNILVAVTEPSKLRLIDFGLARRYHTNVPNQRNPEVEKLYVIGTLDWVSLNAHYGVDLARRDDLESLAYTLLFLLNGELPWQTVPADRSDELKTMKEVRKCKEQHSGDTLAPAGYPEFGELVDHARKLEFREQPDYNRLRQLFKALYEDSGFSEPHNFNWTPVDPPSPSPDNSLQGGQPVETEEESLSDPEDDYADSDESDDSGRSNSYFGLDISDWEMQGTRDLSLTLPPEEIEYLDSQLPQITTLIDTIYGYTRHLARVDPPV